MTDYVPIPCEDYSRLELAIVRRQRLRVAWRGTVGTEHMAALMPLDLVTRHHEEYLVAELGSERIEIRLDRIRSAQPLGGGPPAPAR